MNNQFDELTRNLGRSVTQRAGLGKFGAGLAVTAVASFLAAPAGATATSLGPLVELSRPNPVAGCDVGLSLPGTWTLDVACEPVLAANPVNPRNLAAMWFLGPVRNVIAGVTLDGGRTWQAAPLPITICSAGALLGAGDPGLSFGPTGDLYAINAAGNSFDASGIVVNKSTDGGLHWSAPVFVTDGTGLPADAPSITADPTDARFAYAFWKRNDVKNRTLSAFSRTSDGGQTWEPPRTLFDIGPQYHVDRGHALILPDGTVLVVSLFYYQGPNQGPKVTTVQLIRSTDHGQNWSAPRDILILNQLYQPNSTAHTMGVDPETGQFLADAGDPVFAVDRRNGNLYAAWEDARFSGFQYNDIVFSMSADGGLTWSTPIRVNQTPLTIPPLNRQAFFPAIAVAADGTIGISYYDFRFNDAYPGLPTDYWLIRCLPSSTKPATDPANWGDEVRLTDTSFNLEASLILGSEFFLGDYVEGLAATGNDFVAAFTRVDPDGVNSIVARRVYK